MIFLVGMKGLEPSRVASLAPKASVSTNSTTSPRIYILLDKTIKNQLRITIIFPF